MDFAKSLWDLEIHDQSCWGFVFSFSWIDMLPTCGLGLPSVQGEGERRQNCWSYLRKPERRKGTHPVGRPCLDTESLPQTYRLFSLVSGHPSLVHISWYIFFLFKFFYFSTTAYIQYYFVLVSGVQHSGQTIMYFTKWSPWYFQCPPGPIHGYYSVNDYVAPSVLYVPGTILTTNLYFLILCIFTHSPSTPLIGNHQNTLQIHDLACVLVYLVFSHSIVDR